MRVLGLDTGLRQFGVASYHVTNQRMQVYCHRPPKFERVRSKADERARAAAWLTVKLDGHIGPGVVAVCAEQLSYPPGAVAAAVVGIAWGMVSATCVLAGVPFLSMPVKEARKHVLGRMSATKGEVEEWARESWPDAGWSDLRCEAPHQADAALIAWASAHRMPEIQVAMKIAGGQK